MYSRDKVLLDLARKRLQAIFESSELGAGFKIAMRDLEIRGAGNILGPEQSGHIATVGYEMYCQLLEEATRQIQQLPKPNRPEAHVDLGISAYLPKTWIPGDRQRMDLYRRLTRCTDLDMLNLLEHDARDAFGEPPRLAVLLFALTELRLLAGLYGIESMIKKDPDIILTVNDARRAQAGLTGAPGTLRVIDEKTVYLRMPPSFMEAETSLMVLKNLMRKAYDREKSGEAAAVPTPAAVPPAHPAPAVETPRVAPTMPEKPGKKVATELAKLVSLRDQGILSEDEFQSARRRLVGTA
jgi:transcription-repair coupling factor (superfamily II helicase)